MHFYRSGNYVLYESLFLETGTWTCIYTEVQAIIYPLLRSECSQLAKPGV